MTIYDTRLIAYHNYSAEVTLLASISSKKPHILETAGFRWFLFLSLSIEQFAIIELPQILEYMNKINFYD